MFVLVVAGINLYVKFSVNKYIVNEHNISDDMQAILVLGAMVTPDKRPCLMLKDRLDMAVSLYDDEVAPMIIVSGDYSPPYYDEVGVMKSYLMNEGVPEEAIVLHKKGYSTFDSMMWLSNNADYDIDKCVVVTQKYHLLRAVYIGRYNADVYGVPAEHHPYPQLLKYEVREAFARVKDFVLVITETLFFNATI